MWREYSETAEIAIGRKREREKDGGNVEMEKDAGKTEGRVILSDRMKRKIKVSVYAFRLL